MKAMFSILLTFILLIGFLFAEKSEAVGVNGATRSAQTTPGNPAVKTATRAGTQAGKLQFAFIKNTVTAISTNSITVEGKRVNILSSTKMLRRYGRKSSLSEFSVGDEVSVWGTWTDETKNTINARLVRNLSIQRRKGTFIGTIKSVTSSGFTFEPLRRPTQTVTATSTTKFVDRREKVIKFSDLAIGQRVKVKGLWDNKLNTITEVTQIKNYALPLPTPDKTATSSATP